MRVSTKTRKAPLGNGRPKTNHNEIEVRYRNSEKPRPFSMAAVRRGELKRLFVDRYGHVLPDDDGGRDDAWLMLHHLGWCPGDRPARMKSWLSLWAPWMPAEEATRLVASVTAKPLRWRADTLARCLGLTDADRTRLRITTIGCVDSTKAERAEARRERKARAKMEKRRKRGVRPRDEYLATSAECTKPWEAEGISRRTWYRRQARGTGVTPSILLSVYGGDGLVPRGDEGAHGARAYGLSVALKGTALFSRHKLTVLIPTMIREDKQASPHPTMRIAGGGA
jgi:hypothetical protein